MSQSPGPGRFTASSSCYHQYWFISNVCLCTPPESPLAHWCKLLSIASKRINIFILWAHMYIQTAEIKATFVIGLYSFRRKLIKETCIWHIVNASWTFDSLSASSYLAHWRMPIRCLISVHLSALVMVVEVFCSFVLQYVCAKSFRTKCLDLRNNHFLLKTSECSKDNCLILSRHV